MKVFKFGGASIKDAESVKNVVSVINQTGEKHLVIVVSAMGKMTNALEEVVSDYFSESKNEKDSFLRVYDFHHSLLTHLFPNHSHPVFSELNKLMDELKHFL